MRYSIILVSQVPVAENYSGQGVSNLFEAKGIEHSSGGLMPIGSR